MPEKMNQAKEITRMRAIIRALEGCEPWRAERMLKYCMEGVQQQKTELKQHMLDGVGLAVSQFVDGLGGRGPVAIDDGSEENTEAGEPAEPEATAPAAAPTPTTGAPGLPPGNQPQLATAPPPAAAAPPPQQAPPVAAPPPPAAVPAGMPGGPQ